MSFELQAAIDRACEMRLSAEQRKLKRRPGPAQKRKARAATNVVQRQLFELIRGMHSKTT
jgi:hypothetical protein